MPKPAIAVKPFRIVLSLLLAGSLGAITWVRSPVPRIDPQARPQMVTLALPGKRALAGHLGAFRLDATWQITAPRPAFGGYSALVPQGDGWLWAVSDRGTVLRINPAMARIAVPKPWRLYDPKGSGPQETDAEAAVRDPITGRFWVSWETTNSIVRFSPGWRREATVRPPAMRDWGFNDGPEAMARLADGRFILLREGSHRQDGESVHAALLFGGDPITTPSPMRFAFAGPEPFSPVDMTPLPDGRVLVLLRRLIWPAPARFAGRLAIVDPAEIRAGKVWRAREVARLSSTLPVDNFEGMAIEPGGPGEGGRLTLWLISDNNGAALQRTLLWKLSFDPAEL
ncbi:MAG: esterase-like activity of phytase family protein [Novosphingobium sp.]